LQTFDCKDGLSISSAGWQPAGFNRFTIQKHRAHAAAAFTAADFRACQVQTLAQELS